MLLILTTPLCLLLILSPFDYCYIECNEDDLSYNVYLGVNTTQLRYQAFHFLLYVSIHARQICSEFYCFIMQHGELTDKTFQIPLRKVVHSR